MSSSTSYLPPEDVRTVAVIGTGAVGASWCVLFLAHGLSVIACDPAPDAEAKARDFVTQAWPLMESLGVTDLDEPPLQRLRFVASPAQAASDADLIQENVPEQPALKARVLAELDAHADAATIILSSTGGMPPTKMQEGLRHPERLVVVHPFNPSHLIPLVEVVGGRHTSPRVIEWAMAFARRLGKQPIRLHFEASGHMVNRLQFALVREAVACLVSGMASAEDIDHAVRHGLGPRWALMGSLLTLHLAGGRGGMEGILAHAGQAIEGWWAPTADVRLDAGVRRQLVEAAAQVGQGRDIAQWERWRDQQLVQLLQLQRQGIAQLEQPPETTHDHP